MRSSGDRYRMNRKKRALDVDVGVAKLDGVVWYLMSPPPTLLFFRSCPIGGGSIHVNARPGANPNLSIYFRSSRHRSDGRGRRREKHPTVNSELAVGFVIDRAASDGEIIDPPANEVFGMMMMEKQPPVRSRFRSVAHSRRSSRSSIIIKTCKAFVLYGIPA